MILKGTFFLYSSQNFLYLHTEKGVKIYLVTHLASFYISDLGRWVNTIFYQNVTSKLIRIASVTYFA